MFYENYWRLFNRTTVAPVKVLEDQFPQLLEDDLYRATVHFSNIKLEYLNYIYQARWIGRVEDRLWSSRSADLSIL